MLIDLSSLSANTQTWAKATDTADVSVTVDGTTRVLTGLNAAAYLFGQALGSVQFHDTLDGVQLTDGRFEFPPASDQWVSLSEVADALRYKYGVDPLIEFAPGLGLRGYSVADINGILDLLNEEFADQFSLSLISSSTVASATQATFNTEKAASGSTATYDAAAVSTLLDTASTPNLASATEAELRQELTEGGDLYTDRAGAFYLNGVRTSAIDVAVVSRLLVQDNIASEYKVLMDEYADRNNMIAAAHRFIDGGLSGVSQSIDSAEQQYGWSDALSELTSGQYSDDTFLYWDTDVDADTVTFDTHPGWVTGTQVRIGASMGGVTAGTDYFVRSLGNGAYSFFTTQANALANTSVVDLTEKLERTTNVFAQDAVALSAVGSSNLAIQFNPAKIQGASLSDYDLMANSYYFDLDGNSSSNKDNYLIFSPIDPGWPEDTALEFKSGNGGLTAGTDYYVANWYSGGEKRVQLTGGPGGNANTEDNKLTGKPSGPVMLYDSGAIAGQETIQGYNQFTLPNTNFATGTACRPKEDVHVLLTHTQGTQHYYKAVVAMKAGQEYFLRNESD